MYRIKELADMSGISIRTLHYYDEINLLKPSQLEDNGYRLYNEQDAARLQQILFLKELDFPLSKIKRILDDPQFNEEEALRMHRKILIEKRDRLMRIIQSVDETIEAIKGGKEMDSNKRLKPFDRSKLDQFQKQYEQEVKEKYGQTEAYEQSEKKRKSYKDDDFARIEQERTAIFERIAAVMDRKPEEDAVQELIHEWRMHITRYHYNCTIEIFRGLGDMYTADERFKENLDKIKNGLADYMSEAIRIYGSRHNE
ncbi:MerR family transcriptional regulator [Bacillus sp. FJAT-27916]|uniref:MerR family transcriptional regulator n=1 Tax=Bacillus sp. FJAT-27916 TaxID=1679169 RepID=UPI0009E46823|nr:MerR family transcriptional regulator [Bacillus sp. FJAT-27916]